MSVPPSARARATIRDVAALAGVGTKTVSRVINDEANVSTQMRERVLRAVEALNFTPNLGAGALRRGDRRTMTLGLLLDSVDNPFSAAINRAVEIVASARRTAVFAASSADDPQRERELVDAFTRRRVDGLILTTTGNDQSYLQAERDRGMPLVFIDRRPIGVRGDAVLANNREAAAEATAHLLAHGHRRIAYFGDDPSIATARERREGYLDALASGGIAADRQLQVEGLRSAVAACQAVHRLLADSAPPTAVFAAQNVVTIGAIRALHQLGQQRRIALVSFDDTPMADLIEPGLTAMAQDPGRIGTIAAERLFARLDGDTSPEGEFVVPARLIRRGSGEVAAPPAA